LQGHFPHGVQAVVRDLNHVYRSTPALHASDSDPSGFAWVIGDDQANSVFAFLRRHEGQWALVVCNMTPIPRIGYRVGVPVSGRWVERINTDAEVYGGSNMGNAGGAVAGAQASHGYEQSLSLVLPPLSTLILVAEVTSL
jgi:1,4-alpha-glucan branching enzyme